MGFITDIWAFSGGMSATTAIKEIIDGTEYLKFTLDNYFVVELDKGENIYDENGNFKYRQYNDFYILPSPYIMETNVLYKGSDIGIILRYGFGEYLIIRFNEVSIFLERFEFGKKVTLSGPFNNILTVNELHNIKVIVFDNKFVVYVDNNFICNIYYEENKLTTGLNGFYGSANTLVKDFKIISNKPKYWQQNSYNVIFYKHDNVIKIINLDDLHEGYIYQNVQVQSGVPYCLRYTTNKNGKIQILDGENLIDIDIQNINYYIFTPQNNTIEIRLIPENNVFEVEKIMLSRSDNPLTYVETKDMPTIIDKSIIYVPVEIDTLQKKMIEFEFKPYDTISNKKRSLLYLTSNNKHLNIFYKSDSIGLYIKDDQIEKEELLGIKVKGYEYNRLKVYFVKSQYSIKCIIDYNGTQEMKSIDLDIATDKIYIGCCDIENFYNGNCLFKYLKLYEVVDFEENNNILLKYYDFYGSILERTRGNIINIPTKPRHMSPISVMYEDGTELRRISSFDANTGKYLDHIVENTKYLGNKLIKVVYNDIDTTYFTPIVEFDNGEVYYGTSSDNNIIYLDMTDYQSQKNIGKPCKVKYKIKNSYSVIYDEDDSFKIILNDYQGKKIKVAYSSSDYEKIPIISSNLNPILNPNHKGFIYLTNTTYPLSFIDVYLSKNIVDNSKDDFIIITIDAYDSFGNIISDCNFEFESKYGKVEVLNLSKEPVYLNECAGRYIFIYKPNLPRSDYFGYIDDFISIIEKKYNVYNIKKVRIYI